MYCKMLWIKVSDNKPLVKIVSRVRRFLPFIVVPGKPGKPKKCNFLPGKVNKVKIINLLLKWVSFEHK